MDRGQGGVEHLAGRAGTDCPNAKLRLDFAKCTQVAHILLTIQMVRPHVCATYLATKTICLIFWTVCLPDYVICPSSHMDCLHCYLAVDLTVRTACVICIFTVCLTDLQICYLAL